MADDHPPTADAEPPRAAEPGPGNTAPGSPERRFGTSRRRLDVARGITTAAVVVAAAAAAGVLAVVAGLLTLFGWGVVVVVAILAVGVAAAVRPRPANGWLLVPMLALALPSAAVAISGVRVLPERGRVVETPTTVAQIPDQGYRAGLGSLLVDLRTLEADDGEQIVVRAGSDLGRTVVALPQDRCFNLDVRWQTGNLRLPRVRERPTVTGLRPGRPLLNLGKQTPGNRKRFGTTTGRIALFGRAYAIDDGRWVAPTAREEAPTLTLDLTSEGGSFVVRSYPDDISPLHSTSWPIEQRAPMSPAIYRQREAQRTRSDASTVLRSPDLDSKTPSPGVFSVHGESPQADRWRQLTRHIDGYAREWARRVTGTCNPKGTFR